MYSGEEFTTEELMTALQERVVFTPSVYSLSMLPTLTDIPSASRGSGIHR